MKRDTLQFMEAIVGASSSVLTDEQKALLIAATEEVINKGDNQLCELYDRWNTDSKGGQS